MADNKLSRELNTREKDVRKKAWVRPETLPNPTPEDGYVYHWVRISTMGQADTGNVSSKLREGWILPDEVTDGRFKDNIIQGGLMLCKAPTEMVDERNAYYNNQAASQIHSVDNSLMRENDPRMPLFNDRKTKVTFGKGN